MIFKIEIKNKPLFKNHHGEHIKHEIAGLGVKNKLEVEYCPVYQIEGDLNKAEIDKISQELLIDPITELYEVNNKPKKIRNVSEVEVWFKNGVTDAVADSVAKAVKDLGIVIDITVHTAHKYIIKGAVNQITVKHIAERLLANTMVQKYNIN
jgi:phosphoribosylformylglycinamidine synthase subunit PurSL